MTLATRCPQCATAFRVAPDQIKLRGGWVRCGVCNEVFDSSQSLIELDPAGGAPRPVAAGPAFPPEAPISSPEAPASPPESPVEPHVLRRRGEGLVASMQDDGSQAPTPEPTPSFSSPLAVAAGEAGVPDREATPGAESFPVAGASPKPALTDEAADGALPSVLRSRRAAPATASDGAPVQPPDAEAGPAVAVPTTPALGSAEDAHAPIVGESRPRERESRGDEAPDFLDEEARQRRRRAQWLWGLAALIALLVLLAQAAWIFRAEIATRVPMLRPAMERLCQRWQCTVGYPRAPELLVIESSSVEPWSPESPGFAPPIADEAEPVPGESAGIVLPTRQLALRMVLRNRATFPQSWPAIELSLMDLSDAVAARRVLLPSVYLSPRDFAQPLGPLQERVLRIPIETIDAHATGYRVAIFYP
ncbi:MULTISPECIES: zinc-ribbon and DUF3426 domain-containing protein [unclassified Pigmentiphaga]|uniref:zinc-ribbon and DUF3426 domain-containing protein n=1 Tax=unclassified Pigmentiphaga TaxID=2626614 RepID=UPI000B40D0A2|nr:MULTISPECIES: zinc-ribbon and DUF3426 domain-containing protein [unclassified Pigmentiphaga]OVZ58187.1 hypothetical protein CDO46_27140 [Pigmentiphaga sp. NML030171]